MEFSTIAFFKVVFFMLLPVILFYGIAFVIAFVFGIQGSPLKQEDEYKEQKKKASNPAFGTWAWAMKQQEKENARQREAARQAEIVRISQSQRIY